ncbi:MAG: hypothetical protein H6686_08365 [Fibrobacteria bacterium]|nr:hypothetical protein [Fibrobacteria bacterium]
MVFASPTGRSTSGTFTDPRDGRLYRTTTFQGQTWMAENLSWAGSDGTLGSCVGGTPEGCSTWGRLYTWIEAMQGSTGSDATPSGVQGVCPSGWHLPSAAEWDSLAAHLGGGLLAGDSLKRSGAWTGGSLDGGRDAIGFDAIPSGRHDPDGADYYQGESAFWWTSSRNGTEAIRRDLLRDRSSLYQAATDISGSFAYSHSVRCVKTP